MNFIKKIYLFIFILLLILLFLSGCKFNNENDNKISEQNKQITKLSFESTNNSENNVNLDDTKQNNNNQSNLSEDENTYENSNNSEVEIGSFTTNILDKTENRQSNINLTCSKLNNLEINSR